MEKSTRATPIFLCYIGSTVKCITNVTRKYSEKTNLNNHSWSPAFLVALLLVSAAFGVIQGTSAQGDKPILGYPYLAHGGDNENFSASLFQLNGAATITSMSCQMYIGYSINEKDEDSTYRFAIYSDNNGQIGELIGQTELDTISKPVDNIALTLDEFQTLNFASPISLQAGTYWLAAVVQGPNIHINEDQFVESSQRARCNLNSTSFPSTLSSLQYIDNEVVAIYASGQGNSSVMPPPTVDSSHPGMSSLSVNCQSEGSNGNIQVFGTLSLYGTGIPQAIIEFSYQQIGEPIWRFIGSTNTSTNGSYSIDWSPSTEGNYLINATYWGSSTTSFVFKAVPVLITAPSGNQSQTVFSVDSNSTVANLSFDSANAQLSFSVTGLSGTMGYADVCVSRSLVENVSSIQAYIDDNPVSYTVTSTEDSWILHFYYHHSSHNIMFDLSGAKISSVPDMPEASSVPEMPNEALSLIIVALVTIAALLIIVQRRHRLPMHQCI